METKHTKETRAALLADLTRLMGDDGTGDLVAITDQVIAENPHAEVTVKYLSETVRRSRAFRSDPRNFDGSTHENVRLVGYSQPTVCAHESVIRGHGAFCRFCGETLG